MRQRTGLVLILLGILLAGGTSIMVIRIATQAAEAGRGQIRQVNVVVATRSVLENTPITAGMLALKAFPADFAPPSALGSLDQAVGKFAKGFIAQEQILVADQVMAAAPSPNLSNRVPPGKVAIWLRMPELLANAQVLKPGDHVDILLSVALGTAGEQNQGGAGGLSTQTTLQNVEVFRLGLEEIDISASAPGSATPQDVAGARAAAGISQNVAAGGNPQGGQAAKPNAAGVIGFLVDHQDALIIKFVKDSGGTIDLVLRSIEDQQAVRTDAMTMDSLVERFRFRLPQTVAR